MLNILCNILCVFVLLTLSGCKSMDFHKTGKFYGSGVFKNKSYEKLIVHGSANCYKVTVHESLKVHGTANLSQSKVGSLEVYGLAFLQETIVTDLCRTTGGSLKVQNSILGNLSTSSNDVTISNSKTKSIRVKSKEWKFDDPFIVLINTIVDGDIAFYGANGKVYIEGNSRITGKVSGGKIINKH